MSSAAMADLPAPVRVSPLIKFGRWSFLAVGVLYGLSRQSRLSKKENALRVIEDKKKAEREAKHAADKERLSKEELVSLARAAGVKVDP